MIKSSTDASASNPRSLCLISSSLGHVLVETMQRPTDMYSSGFAGNAKRVIFISHRGITNMSDARRTAATPLFGTGPNKFMQSCMPLTLILFLNSLSGFPTNTKAKSVIFLSFFALIASIEISVL